jgi:hypothetical protein
VLSDVSASSQMGVSAAAGATEGDVTFPLIPRESLLHQASDLNLSINCLQLSRLVPRPQEEKNCSKHASVVSFGQLLGLFFFANALGTELNFKGILSSSLSRDADAL